MVPPLSLPDSVGPRCETFMPGIVIPYHLRWGLPHTPSATMFSAASRKHA